MSFLQIPILRFLPRSSTSTRLLQLGSSALIATSLIALRASAETTLTVDLGTTIRPVTHVGSGSLYGLIENRPADLDALVAPLSPNMFTNPAANVQQPIGDAIAVAQRVAPLGAVVTIRLADWFPNWPYNFTDMDDWFDKLSETAARRQSSGVANYYGYEIWNEPDLTWTSSMPFNDFWKATYDELKRLDPDMPIIGPSLSYYNSSQMQDFLSFARDNNCVPEIIAWHEMVGGNVGNDFDSYRALEQQLGVGPLLISINEYSGEEHIDDEGQPGASAPLIAKFERYGVDTACLSFWDVPNPGRLGSLLANDTTPNGGWWFYKWYGDMSGDMLATVPPAPGNVSALDGFANLDTANGFASVVFAGVNDGTIRVVVNGLAASGIFDSSLRAIVEHAPWVNRTTPVASTNTLDDVELPLENDQLEFTIPNANDFDGYRIYLVGNPLPDDTDGGSGGTATSGGGSSSAAAGGSAADGSMAVTGVGGVNATTSTVGSSTSSGTTTLGSGGAGGASATSSIASGGATTSTEMSSGEAATTGTPQDITSGLPLDAPGTSGNESGCNCGVAGRPAKFDWLIVVGLALVTSVSRRRWRA